MTTEYWVPQTFKLGDRVRVRLSGECGGVRVNHKPDGDVTTVGHEPEEDERTGTVAVPPVPLSTRNGHTVCVNLDDWGRRINWYVMYAPIELEPLDNI